jgi:hypothetical protein
LNDLVIRDLPLGDIGTMNFSEDGNRLIGRHEKSRGEVSIIILKETGRPRRGSFDSPGDGPLLHLG